MPLDVVDLLSRLVDKSLVQADHAEGTARYRLLETIRQFADQRLGDAGERAARVRAHRDWYVAFAAAHRSLAAGTELDVADPMGRAETVHRVVADEIDRHVRMIAGRLGPLLSAP